MLPTTRQAMVFANIAANPKDFHALQFHGNWFLLIENCAALGGSFDIEIGDYINGIEPRALKGIMKSVSQLNAAMNHVLKKAVSTTIGNEATCLLPEIFDNCTHHQVLVGHPFRIIVIWNLLNAHFSQQLPGGTGCRGAHQEAQRPACAPLSKMSMLMDLEVHRTAIHQAHANILGRLPSYEQGHRRPHGGQDRHRHQD